MRPKKSQQPEEVKHHDAGSLTPGEPVYLAVGRLRRPHGIKGEIILEVYSDSQEYFNVGNTLFTGETYIPMVLDGVRPHDKLLIIHFANVDTPEDASNYTNQLAYVPTSVLKPLPDGQYYFFQLIGLKAVNDQGENLGILTEIIQTGAVPVYVVTSEEGKEQLFPALAEVVVSVKLKEQTITLKPQEWE